VQVYACSASNVKADDVVDTTGAGDAFIASLVYGICNQKPIADMLELASLVSACKCTQLGARPGLPKREQLPQGLL
jgi:sugar/nucleoside kinase (ribokinase family)